MKPPVGKIGLGQGGEAKGGRPRKPGPHQGQGCEESCKNGEGRELNQVLLYSFAEDYLKGSASIRKTLGRF